MHRDRRHQAGAGWDVLTEQAAKNIKDRGGRDGQHRVDAASTGSRCPVEVHCGPASSDTDCDAQAHGARREPVVIKKVFCLINAVRDPSQGLAHQARRVLLQRFEVEIGF